MQRPAPVYLVSSSRWIKMQSAPAIGSRQDQHSVSTGHWFPSGSSFNQHSPLVPDRINIQSAPVVGSRLDQDAQHRPLVPVWIVLQSAPVYLVSNTQWIKMHTARNYPATYGAFCIGTGSRCNQHRPLVPVWLKMHRAQPISSRLAQDAQSTAH